MLSLLRSPLLLSRGDRLCLARFGSITVSALVAREANNSSTADKIAVPASKSA